MHLTSKFRYGKYKDCSLLYVIENDPHHIEWMMEEKGLKLSNKAYQKYIQVKESV